MAATQAEGKPVLPISVNFSRVHLHDFNFPQRLLALTKKYGVDPKKIEIELTETAFALNAKEQYNAVNKLHEYGFTVAIDDFGSGFSSLNMLKDFDFDILKIDMKFLEDFELGGKVGTVLTSVIRLAKWLGIPVVAEGVETKEQLDFLRSLGCEMIQGYVYSRPLSRGEYEILLDQKDSISILKEKPMVVATSNMNALLGGDGTINSILDGILGGFGIYEFTGKALEAIRVNRAYYDTMGYPDAVSFRAHSLNVLTQVYPSDVKKMLDACNMAVETGTVQKISARRYLYNGTLCRFDCLVKYIGGAKDRPFLCITFIDATERLRVDREKELSKYCDALHGIFDEIFEFDYKTDTLCLLSREHVKRHEEPRKLKEAERNWAENIIHPDDREKMEEYILLARADEIKLPFSADYRIIRNGEIRWISASVVSIAGGSYLLCKLDITQKKQMEILFENMEALQYNADQGVIPDVFNNSEAENSPTKRKMTANT